MFVYQLMFQDEYNNLFDLGFYKNLNEAVPEINYHLKGYNCGKHQIKTLDITTYPTHNLNGFEINLAKHFNDDEGDLWGCYIRGFIFWVDNSLDELLFRPEEKKK